MNIHPKDQYQVKVLKGKNRGKNNWEINRKIVVNCGGCFSAWPAAGVTVLGRLAPGSGRCVCYTRQKMALHTNHLQGAHLSRLHAHHNTNTPVHDMIRLLCEIQMVPS